MTTAEQATHIILGQQMQYGTELVPFHKAMGRILAEPLHSDRDMPPYNRISMDGIAISFAAYENGVRSYTIAGTQAAGDQPMEIATPGECIEIMTGCALPATTDTIIPYEELDIANGIARIVAKNVSKGQNIHYKGKDRRQNDELVPAGRIIDATLSGVAATVGKTALLVRKLPRVVIISTGDELVDIHEMPADYQIRRSNNYVIWATLQQYGIAADMLHFPDNIALIERELHRCLQEYDVLTLSGGISMGKYDHLPAAMELLGVEKLFHKVQQRPGKPFWFGRRDKKIVFAFPGNPVSTFMCLHRYMLPWLDASLGITRAETYAILAEDVGFTPALTYFMQVMLRVNKKGELLASPMQGNGSGDLANLLETDAFMELPAERSNFTKGEVFKIWKFK